MTVCQIRRNSNVCLDMNLDEFGFFNQQLAGMLRQGIPLEGAMRQLCASMQQGKLRTEIVALASDLAKGAPLREALPRRRLPQLYVEVVQVGAQANNLPGTLTLLADYYQHRHALWMRLKGLMVYPAIVLLGCILLSVLLGRFVAICRRTLLPAFRDVFEGTAVPPDWQFGAFALWMPLAWMLLMAVLFFMAISIPAWRDWLRWRLPGFRESSLSQLAATLRLLISGGNDLGQSLALMARLEAGTRLGRELERWRQRIGSGMAKFGEFAAGSPLVPPLFLWLVGQSGEALADGLGRAADLYRERARHRTELLLYAALPVAILVLGVLILTQVHFAIRALVFMINMLGYVGE